MTRRALLAAAGGGAAGLAGCGPPEKTVVAPTDVLGRQLRAARAVSAAFAGLPASRRAEVVRLAARADARVERLGGRPARAGAAPEATLDAVLAASQAALRAHVAGVGLTTDRELRTLLAELVDGTATDQSELLAALGRPPLAGAFPGQPA